MCVCPYVYVCLCVVEPSTVYGFHCMQESLQIASNILSPNYTSQWGTLNKVSTYTEHSTTQSPGSGQLYEVQLCHMHSTEDMNVYTNWPHSLWCSRCLWIMKLLVVCGCMMYTFGILPASNGLCVHEHMYILTFGMSLFSLCRTPTVGELLSCFRV